MVVAPLLIIAGFGPGVGFAVARRFAGEGFRLALIARRGAAPETVAALRDAGAPEVVGYPADLADFGTLPALFSRIAEDQGAAAVLVYNGARRTSGPALAVDPADFHRDLAVGVTGPLAAIRQVHGSMKAAGGGTILVTGGGYALAPETGGEVVSLVAAKAGVRALVLALAPILGPDRIHLATVTIAGLVAPGTPFDPARIAEEYWTLHTQPAEAWEVERVFRGAQSGP